MRLSTITADALVPDPPVIDPAEILVGVPALDEERHIERCIRGIIGGDPWMRRVRVLVADGGSSDRTEGIVRRLPPGSSRTSGWWRTGSGCSRRE